MAVREFDGTDDDLVTDIGALSGMTYGTIAILFKPAAVSRPFFTMETSGGTDRVAWYIESDNVLAVYTGGYPQLTATLSVNTWQLLISRLNNSGAGSQERASIYNYSSQTWTHTQDSSGFAPWTSTGAGGKTRFHSENIGGVWFSGRIAVRAAWANEVHWATDSTGDSQIEAAGLETALQNWMDEAPDALWPFNQASVATPVDDIIGAADQSAITGTTVVTGDDPPGFSFSLGPAPNLFVTRSNLQLR